MNKNIFTEIDGIRIVENSGVNRDIKQFEDYDIAESGSHRVRKGQIKIYERENFMEEYGFELGCKKSDFPFSMTYKDGVWTKEGKCTFINHGEDVYSVLKIKGQPKDTLCLMFWNDVTTILVHKDDAEKLMHMLEEDKADNIINKAWHI